jgi:predicted transcriptional regulator
MEKKFHFHKGKLQMMKKEEYVEKENLKVSCLYSELKKLNEKIANIRYCSAFGDDKYTTRLYEVLKGLNNHIDDVMFMIYTGGITEED